MSTLQAQAFERMEKLSESKLQLIIEIMDNLIINTEDTLSMKHNNRRPIGLFKNERFLADGYDIDDNIDTYCV